MEPTIYKPSIYKGAGIYKTVVGSSSSISNQITQEFVYKNILGKEFKCVEIESGIFWPLTSLEYIDENIELINDESYYDYTQPQAMKRNYGNNGPLYYTMPARNIINQVANSQPTYLKPISKTYFDKLMKYILDKVEEWKGESVYLENRDLTTFCKFQEFGNYEPWLALIDIGLNITGYFNQNGTFSLRPYSYSNPIYFGVSSAPDNYGQTINLQYGKELVYTFGNIGVEYSYQMRFFIDEN